MGVLQPWHLIIILVIILVVFGPGKLPQLGKAVGDSMRDFKKAIDHSPEQATEELAPGMRLECLVQEKFVSLAESSIEAMEAARPGIGKRISSPQGTAPLWRAELLRNKGSSASMRRLLT